MTWALRGRLGISCGRLGRKTKNGSLSEERTAVPSSRPMISATAIFPPRMEIGRLGSRRARYSRSLRSRSTTGSPSRSGPLRYLASTVARVGLFDGIGAVAFFLQLFDQFTDFLRAVE